MDVVLIVIRDQGGVIGTTNGIPWDYSDATKEIASLIKGNTVIFGRNAYDMFSDLKKVRTAHKIVLSNNVSKNTKTVSYCDNPYFALAMAKNYEKTTYVIGGISTMRCFLEENLITKIIFYTFRGQHEGVKFVNGGTTDYSLCSFDTATNFVAQHYVKVPKEMKVGPALQKLDAPSIDTLKSLSDNEIKKALYNDDELNDLLNDSDSASSSDLDRVYDYISTYADNQAKIMDRVNNLVTTTQTYTSVIISIQERIKYAEEFIAKMSSKEKIKNVIMYSSLGIALLSLVLSICLH